MRCRFICDDFFTGHWFWPNKLSPNKQQRVIHSSFLKPIWHNYMLSAVCMTKWLACSFCYWTDGGVVYPSLSNRPIQPDRKRTKYLDVISDSYIINHLPVYFPQDTKNLWTIKQTDRFIHTSWTCLSRNKIQKNKPESVARWTEYAAFCSRVFRLFSQRTFCRAERY